MTDRPNTNRRTARLVSAGVLGVAGAGAAGAIAYGAAGQGAPAATTTTEQTPAAVQPEMTDQQAYPEQDPAAGSYYSAPDDGTSDQGLSGGGGAAPDAGTGAS